MPREIVHWVALEQTVAEISKELPSSALTLLLNEHRPFSYLGAIAQDAGYFCLGGTVELAEFIAEVLHGGEGEDTFAPIHALVVQALKLGSPDRERLLAFAFGMYSHAVVDIHFHPMVYYLTGDYYHPDKKEMFESRRRHRLFETYLDVWWSRRYKLWNENSVGQVLSAIGTNSRVIYDGLISAIELNLARFTDRPLPKPPTFIRLWPGSFLSLSLIQCAFRSIPWGVFFRGLFYFIRPLAAIDALFLLGRDKELNFFNQPIKFQNPWSGDSNTKTIDELMADAVSESVRLLLDVKRIIDSGELSQLDNIKGRSLNSGLAASNKAGARYFGIDSQMFLT